MKKKLLPAVIAIFCAVSTQAQPAGVIAHWDFTSNGTITNGTVVPDISGNNHDGIVHGNITAETGILGNANTAFYFQHDSSYSTYVSVPYAPDLNLTTFTLSAIIKPRQLYTGTCQGNDIICRGLDYVDGHYALALTDNAYNDCFTVDTNSFIYESTIGNTYYNDTLFRYMPAVVMNDWYTVDLTFDGTMIKIYFNGVLKSSVVTNGTGIGMSTDGLFIGADVVAQPDFPYPFVGVIDDIIIYNRPLVDTEIYNYRTSNPSSVATVQQQNEISIYPNPAKDVINIKSATLQTGQSTFTIKNIAGQTVQTGALRTNQLGVAGLAPGVYFLQLQNDKESSVLKFIKE